MPSTQPSSQPSSRPSVQPSSYPSNQPTSQPSGKPSNQPSSQPTSQPSSQPSCQPTRQPSIQPSNQPSVQPTGQPSDQPSSQPSAQPSMQPTSQPSRQPSGQPSSQPSGQPSCQPTNQPSSQPSSRPTCQPTCQPSGQPSCRPSIQPSAQPVILPTSMPSAQPTACPTGQPSPQPTVLPTSQPSCQPTRQPTVQPTALPSMVLKSNFVPFSQYQILAQNNDSLTVSIVLATKMNVNIYCAAYNVNSVSRPYSNDDIIKRSENGITTRTTRVIYVISGLLPLTTYKMYCLSASVDNVQMPFRYVETNALLAKTTCCRLVRIHSLFEGPMIISTNGNSQGNIGLYELSIELQDLPTSRLSVQLIFRPTNTTLTSDELIPPAIYPDTLSVSNGSSTLKFQGITVFPQFPGSYQLTVRLFGSSAAEYYATLDRTEFVVEQASSYVPQVPRLVAAAFSNDGSTVQLVFDSATNRGGFANAFPCSQFLVFRNINWFLCRWISDTTIALQSISSSAEYALNVNDTISLQGMNNITASCIADSNVCTSYQPVESINVTVATPTSGIRPSIVFTAPSKITSCSPLTLDISSSTGSGGRPWSTYEFEVFDSVAAQAKEIESYLNGDDYSLFPVSPIPAFLFRKGRTYIFQLRLCNFLQSCSISRHLVAVGSETDSAVLSATIFGMQSRHILPSTEVLLQAQARFEICNQSTQLSEEMSQSVPLLFSWRVSLENGTILSSLLSTSNNPRQFRLPAYTLVPNMRYVVWLSLQATAPTSTISSSVDRHFSANTSVLFTVLPEIVIPILSVSKPQIVLQFNKSIVLDASQSYDRNKAEGRGVAGGLSFAWSCIQVKPVFNMSICPLQFLQRNWAVGSKFEFLNATSSKTFVGTTARVRVVVANAEGISNSTSVYIDVVDVASPIQLDLVLHNGVATNFDYSTKLVLIGSISSHSRCVASWNVNDPTITLQNASHTPIEILVSENERQGNIAPVYFLTVQPFSLLPSASYLFTFTCNTSTASLSIFTNAPPSPGLFSVQPVSGFEALTTYTLNAAFWLDADLPLSYAFLYQQNFPNTSLPIQGRSETSLSQSYLPSGPRSLGFKLDCIVMVYDALDASSNMTSTVIVQPLGQDSKFLWLSSAFGSSNTVADIANSSYNEFQDVDSLRSRISLTSSLLNAPNCSHSPSCTLLHRQACFRTLHTCGPCVAGYMGDVGDSNTPCISAAAYDEFVLVVLGGRSPSRGSQASNAVSDRREKVFSSTQSMLSTGLGLMESVFCEDDTFCATFGVDSPWYYCDVPRKRCKILEKTCARDCSGHGYCVLKTVISMDAEGFVEKEEAYNVTSCPVYDSSCYSSCDCHTGYYGPSCEYDETDWLVRQSARVNSLYALQNLTKREIISQSTVKNWANTLWSISLSPAELYGEAFGVALELCQLILDYAKTFSIPATDDKLLAALQALDTLAAYETSVQVLSSTTSFVARGSRQQWQYAHTESSFARAAMNTPSFVGNASSLAWESKSVTTKSNSYRSATYNNTYLQSRGLVSVARSYSSLLLSNIFPGEESLSVAFNNLRFTTSPGSLYVNRSLYEMQTNEGDITSSRLVFNASRTAHGDAYVSFVVAQFTANVYRNKQAVKSNPMLMTFRTGIVWNDGISGPRFDYSASTDIGDVSQQTLAREIDNVEIDILHTSQVSSFLQASVVQNFTTVCNSSVAGRTILHRCRDSGFIIQHRCTTSYYGQYLSYCPGQVPACRRIVGLYANDIEDLVASPTCDVVRYDVNRTICRCTFSADASAMSRARSSFPSMSWKPRFASDQYMQAGVVPAEMSSSLSESWLLDGNNTVELAVGLSYNDYYLADIFFPAESEPERSSYWMTIALVFPMIFLLGAYMYERRKLAALLQYEKKMSSKASGLTPNTVNNKHVYTVRNFNATVIDRQVIQRNEVSSPAPQKVAVGATSPGDIETSRFASYVQIQSSLPDRLAVVTRRYLDVLHHLLPIVFHRDIWWIGRLVAEIKQHWSLTKLLLPDRQKMVKLHRMREMLRMFVLQSCMLLALAFLLDIQADDEENGYRHLLQRPGGNQERSKYCEQFLTEDTCVARKSWLDSTVSLCQWEVRDEPYRIIRPTQLQPIAKICSSNDWLLSTYSILLIISYSVVGLAVVDSLLEPMLGLFDALFIPKVKVINDSTSDNRPRSSSEAGSNSTRPTPIFPSPIGTKKKSLVWANNRVDVQREDASSMIAQNNPQLNLGSPNMPTQATSSSPPFGTSPPNALVVKSKHFRMLSSDILLEYGEVFRMINEVVGFEQDHIIVPTTIYKRDLTNQLSGSLDQSKSKNVSMAKRSHNVSMDEIAVRNDENEVEDGFKGFDVGIEKANAEGMQEGEHTDGQTNESLNVSVRVVTRSSLISHGLIRYLSGFSSSLISSSKNRSINIGQKTSSSVQMAENKNQRFDPDEVWNRLERLQKLLQHDALQNLSMDSLVCPQRGGTSSSEALASLDRDLLEYIQEYGKGWGVLDVGNHKRNRGIFFGIFRDLRVSKEHQIDKVETIVGREAYLQSRAVEILYDRERAAKRHGEELSRSLYLLTDKNGSRQARMAVEVFNLTMQHLMMENSVASRIFALKFNANHKVLLSLQRWNLQLLALLLAAVTVYILYFALNIIVSRTASWQRILLTAYAAQTALEVFVLSPLYVSILHFCIPSLVSGYVQAAYEHLQQHLQEQLPCLLKQPADDDLALGQGVDSMPDDELSALSSLQTLNAARYFTSAYQLTHPHFAQSLEARWVSRFPDPWPGDLLPVDPTRSSLLAQGSQDKQLPAQLLQHLGEAKVIRTAEPVQTDDSVQDIRRDRARRASQLIYDRVRHPRRASQAPTTLVSPVALAEEEEELFRREILRCLEIGIYIMLFLRDIIRSLAVGTVQFVWASFVGSYIFTLDLVTTLSWFPPFLILLLRFLCIIAVLAPTLLLLSYLYPSLSLPLARPVSLGLCCFLVWLVLLPISWMWLLRPGAKLHEDLENRFRVKEVITKVATELRRRIFVAQQHRDESNGDKNGEKKTDGGAGTIIPMLTRTQAALQESEGEDESDEEDAPLHQAKMISPPLQASPSAPLRSPSTSTSLSPPPRYVRM
ncbi:hypothetical protein EON65_19985, partial [archaeon]